MNGKWTLAEVFEVFTGGIRVPRIQRGYVQGRENSKGEAIRAEFVPALVAAVFGEKPLSLDFLYGVAVPDAQDSGRCLLLLDGQQRLTTLALLAWLCGKWDKSWQFGCEARRIPELFMRDLLASDPPTSGKASEAICAAGWFLPVWEKEPSVGGMLRMLDALEEKIGERDRAAAKLENVTFLLHGIDGASDTFDHIFRKMNARGKELSPWENLKAMLDKYVPKPLADEWHEKVDGDWPECIWAQVGNDIGKLDNAMEKIVRMAYARFAGPDGQTATLWQMEGKIAGGGEGSFDKATCKDFFQTAGACFDALPAIAGCWAGERSQNALWGRTGGEAEFWKWLSDGQSASPSNLLRMAFLVEKARCGDDHRRRRILLNLLDASSINKDNFAKALGAGMEFLAGALDLDALMERKDGYSPEQLEDEIRKRAIDENSIVAFEKDDLVFHGSLRFIGWGPFRDAEDIRERLESIRGAIAGDRWLDFYQNFVSRIAEAKFDGRYAYTPLRANDTGVWRKNILTDGRFIDAVKSWHEAPDIHPDPPMWVHHLADLLQGGKVSRATLRCWNGWMFLLQTDAYRSANSIRLDRNENERKNRQLLRAGQVYYAAPWPWAEAKEAGVWYKIDDPSWWESDAPPKWGKDANGGFVIASDSTEHSGANE